MVKDLGEKHIRETIEKFNICTGIPINAFRSDGMFIDSIGYTEDLNLIFDINDIYEKALDLMLEKPASEYKYFMYNDYLGFTICNVCPRSSHKGVYIIGPYRFQENNCYKHIVYKSLECMPYIINLLRDIARSSDFIKMKIKSKKMGFNLHVKKAIDYIESKYYENITLDKMCSYLDVNKSYFCTIFKRETGETFSKFLNKTRVERSKQLLINERIPLLEVALSVGFNNQNYYNMAFKGLINKTPLEFRNAEMKIG